MLFFFFKNVQSIIYLIFSSQILFSNRCIVLSIWIYSTIVSSLLINSNMVSYESRELMCSPKWTQENSRNSYLAAVLYFSLPSIILFVSNVYVIHTVRRAVSPSQNFGAENESGSQTNTKNHTKTLRCFYVLHIMYFVFGVPYFIGKFSYVTIKNGLFSESLMVLFMLLMFIESSVNPFIYSLLRKEHRKALSETIKMLSAMKNNFLSTIGVKFKKYIFFSKMSDTYNA